MKQFKRNMDLLIRKAYCRHGYEFFFIKYDGDKTYYGKPLEIEWSEMEHEYDTISPSLFIPYDQFNEALKEFGIDEKQDLKQKSEAEGENKAMKEHLTDLRKILEIYDENNN